MWCEAHYSCTVADKLGSSQLGMSFPSIHISSVYTGTLLTALQLTSLMCGVGLPNHLQNVSPTLPHLTMLYILPYTTLL